MKESVQFVQTPQVNNAPYVSAFREFIKSTIANPSFFDLSPMEQKQAAMNMIQKHKAMA